MRVFRHGLFLTAPFLICGAASASEGTSNILVLGMNEAQVQKFGVCSGRLPASPTARVEACTQLLDEPIFRKSIPDQSPVYLYRSTANLALKRFDAAIADADKALASLPEFENASGQRCWARAYAGVQLDAAMDACLHAIKLGGTDAKVLDSMGLLRLRSGNWYAAVSDYDFASKWRKDALYGRILAEYGARAAEDPAADVQQQIWKERIAPLEAELGEEGIAAGKQRFKDMGITQESIEQQAKQAAQQ